MHHRRMKLHTFTSDVNNHSRISLTSESVLLNMIDGFSGVTNQVDGKTLIGMIHSKTHVHPSTFKIILMRSKKWQPSMKDPSMFLKPSQHLRIC